MIDPFVQSFWKLSPYGLFWSESVEQHRSALLDIGLLYQTHALKRCRLVSGGFRLSPTATKWHVRARTKEQHFYQTSNAWYCGAPCLCDQCVRHKVDKHVLFGRLHSQVTYKRPFLWVGIRCRQNSLYPHRSFKRFLSFKVLETHQPVLLSRRYNWATVSAPGLFLECWHHVGKGSHGFGINCFLALNCLFRGGILFE